MLMHVQGSRCYSQPAGLHTTTTHCTRFSRQAQAKKTTARLARFWRWRNGVMHVHIPRRAIGEHSLAGVFARDKRRQRVDYLVTQKDTRGRSADCRVVYYNNTRVRIDCFTLPTMPFRNLPSISLSKASTIHYLPCENTTPNERMNK